MSTDQDDVPGGADAARRAAREDQPGVQVDGLQRLWAPWRFGYVAGDDPIQGCPFCVLPSRGTERDRESLILHRGEHTYVIFNAFPYNPGHLMAVPYAHHADLDQLSQPASQELFELGRRCVRVLREQVSAQGVNLGMNVGAAAGAGIADHLHLHAVPRWNGDTNFISVIGNSRVLPRALDELYDELLGGFDGR